MAEIPVGGRVDPAWTAAARGLVARLRRHHHTAPDAGDKGKLARPPGDRWQIPRTKRLDAALRETAVSAV